MPIERAPSRANDERMFRALLERIARAERESVHLTSMSREFNSSVEYSTHLSAVAHVPIADAAKWALRQIPKYSDPEITILACEETEELARRVYTNTSLWLFHPFMRAGLRRTYEKHSEALRSRLAEAPPSKEGQIEEQIMQTSISAGKLRFSWAFGQFRTTY